MKIDGMGSRLAVLARSRIGARGHPPTFCNRPAEIWRDLYRRSPNAGGSRWSRVQQQVLGFYGELSNVEYTITVTDSQTGIVKTYFNPSGTLGNVADTAAF